MKMKKHSSGIGRGLLLISMMLTVCASGVAQYRDSLGGNWNNPTSATITNLIMDSYARRRLEQHLGAAHSGAAANTRSSDSVRRAGPINDAALRFRSTGTQLKTREIADLIGSGNQQVFAIMTAILQEYEKGARAAGKPNDVGLALSFFFAMNASIYHNTAQPTDQQMMELRETIAEALVEGNGLAGVSDRQKQEMYETLVLYTGFALAAYQEGKQTGNSASVDVGRQLAGQNLQAVTGISADKINFTNQGLSIDREPAAASKGTATRSSAQPPSQLIEHWIILREFRDNRIAAEQRYVGKRVTIVGALDMVLVEHGKPVVRMSVPAWSGDQMFCVFDGSQKAAVARLVPDQRVVMECTVRGSVGGYDQVGRVDLGSSVGRITLDDCVLK
jgi:uncharacterized protein DUF6683/putative nucleic acid binding protein